MATRMVVEDGRYTGEIAFYCYGEGKAQAIRELADRSTVIVIAHKLSTVTAADNIVVLSDGGAVDDTGTHDQLMARGGRYADFWAQRTSASGWTVAKREAKADAGS